MISPAASERSEIGSANKREDRQIRELAREKVAGSGLPVHKADVLLEKEYGAMKTRALMRRLQ